MSIKNLRSKKSKQGKNSRLENINYYCGSVNAFVRNMIVLSQEYQLTVANNAIWGEY
jgi:hypothetical protein